MSKASVLFLARDDTPRSASTLLREQQDPAVRLRDAIERYTDALRAAAEHVVGVCCKAR